MRKTYDQEELKRLFLEKGYEVQSFFRDKKWNNLHAKYVCQKHRGDGEKSLRCSAFLLGQGCKSCATENTADKIRFTHEEFMARISKDRKKEYQILDKYTTANKKIAIKHNVCGKTYKIRAFNFFRGDECPFCQGRYRSTDDFKKEVYQVAGNEYEVIGEYVRSHSKITMKHILCGREYNVSPRKFLSGRRCPSCSGRNTSKLSLKIETFLCSYGIKYKKEYRFDDCRNVLPLPFDFAVYDDKNDLFCLIEADGEQHTNNRCQFGREENHFEETQRNDQTKNKYCEDKKIKLVRIGYDKENDVEKLLEKKLKKLIKNKIKTNDIDKDLYFHRKLKLDEKTLLKIREEYSSNDVSKKFLAKKYNVSKYFIQEVLKYNFMPHVGSEYKKHIAETLIKRRWARSTEMRWIDKKSAEEIVDLYDTGFYSLRTLAKKYNTNHRNISALVKKRGRKIIRIYNKKDVNDALSGVAEIEPFQKQQKEKEKEKDVFEEI